jgi:hypothetical protein
MKQGFQRENMIHHVPPHTMWAHIFEDGEMDSFDEAHIIQCSQCLEAFNVCLKSESFASALKALPAEDQSDLIC